MCLFCYCASFLVSHQVGDPGCWPESLQLHPSSISRRLASAGCQIVTSHSFLVPDEDLACRHPPSGRRIVFWIILSFLNCLLELSLTRGFSPGFPFPRCVDLFLVRQSAAESPASHDCRLEFPLFLSWSVFS